MGQIMGEAHTDSTIYTVATLPVGATEGSIAYASDARKAGQTTGNGTGNLLFYDGTNWIAVDTGATAAA